MKATFLRGALAATCAVAMAGTLAGSASAAVPGPRDFGSSGTLETICSYYQDHGPAPASAVAAFESAHNIDLVYGTPGNDTYSGGSGSQMFIGFGGSDTVSMGSGNDYVCGGAGDDVIDLGSGNDEAIGSQGRDVINGGSGNDRIRGGMGSDVLSGGSDDDWIDGGNDADSDTCSGGSGTNAVMNCP